MGLDEMKNGLQSPAQRLSLVLDRICNARAFGRANDFLEQVQHRAVVAGIGITFHTNLAVIEQVAPSL